MQMNMELELRSLSSAVAHCVVAYAGVARKGEKHLSV